jgi:hypothetical protein
MRWKYLVIGIAILLTMHFGPRFLTFGYWLGQSTNEYAEFFRLIAKYQHGDEIIDFNVVAGCGVQVTTYGDNDKSYIADRDPVVFAKKTKDGGAIWQIMPEACAGGETTENGEVPKDFLPGAIWFDDANDHSFGIAYVTEDAFANPNSKLKFLGASLHHATKEEWEAFQPIAATNLVESRPFNYGNPPVPMEEIKANLWNKEKIAKWRPKISCYLIERYELSDPTERAVLRKYWPEGQPQFWMPTGPQYKLINDGIRRMFVNGVPAQEYFQLGHYQSRAFPTRSRGGMLRSGRPSSQLPIEIYPIRSDDGIPWLTPSLARAGTIFRDIDYGAGSHRGFAYCYSSFRTQDDITKAHMPDYFKRRFLTRVDGQAIYSEEKLNQDPVNTPWQFFERDVAVYQFSGFGLQ